MNENEQVFSRSLTLKLTRCGFNVTRIESHGTGNGIPDMYVLGNYADFWIELKTDNRYSSESRVIKPAWRPGQQAWFQEYRRHMHDTRYGLTLMSAKDCIFIIPMDQHYKANVVEHPWYVTYKEWAYLTKAENTRAANRLNILLRTCSTFQTEQVNSENKTNRRIFVDWVDYVFSLPFHDYDFDPDVCWEAADTNLQLDGPYEPKFFHRNKVKLLLSCMHCMNV